MYIDSKGHASRVLIEKKMIFIFSTVAKTSILENSFWLNVTFQLNIYKLLESINLFSLRKKIAFE